MSEIYETSLEAVTEQHELNVELREGAPKNILLLNLSTFVRSKKLFKSNFSAFNGKTYSGIYQLDPIPKMLSDLLAEKGEYLDEIIMLATEETLEEETITVPLDDGGSVEITCSPKHFFISQVKNYLRPLSPVPDPDEDPRFHHIKVEKKEKRNPSKQIAEAVEFIRKEFDDNNGNVKLYIDAHGSLRGLTLATLAINSLLLREGKGAEKVYSIELGTNEIFVDPADEMFFFVSGMNEFSSFGRIDSLEKYMDGSVSELTVPMKEAAEAISVCNIGKFENAICEIRKYFGRESRSGSTTADDRENYLAIFEERIKEDYGKLIDGNDSVFDEIEWCLKKELYQAALTIAESRVPEYIFGSAVNENGKPREGHPEDRISYSVTTPKLPLLLLSEEEIRNSIRMWKEDSKYGETKGAHFETWLLNNIYFDGGNSGNVSGYLKGNYNELLDTYSETAYFNNRINLTLTVRDGYDENDVKRFLLLLRMLKSTRNTINHCNDEQIPSPQLIHDALVEFIKLARGLENTYTAADTEAYNVSFAEEADSRSEIDTMLVSEITKRAKGYIPTGRLKSNGQEAQLSWDSYRQNRSVKVGDELKVKIKNVNQDICICEIIKE